MTDKYTSSVLLTSNVNITPNRIEQDINRTILEILKKRYEGVCNKDGYIIKDSVQLVKRSIGQIKTINNTSFVNFNVTYTSDIILPSVDSIYESHIETKNKLGIISYIKLNDSDDMKDSPFIIITPKEYISEDDFNSLQINDKIKIKVKSFRIKYLSKHIQIVSVLV